MVEAAGEEEEEEDVRFPFYEFQFPKLTESVSIFHN